MRKAERIFEYLDNGRKKYRVDMYCELADGRKERYREAGFQTLKAAEAAVQHRLDKRFEKPKPKRLTVDEAWDLYSKARGLESSRWQHVGRHLGKIDCTDLHQGIVDAYRAKRRTEPQLTRKLDASGAVTLQPRLVDGQVAYPSDQSLDHEIMLLKAALNYAVKCRRLEAHPLAGVPLLRTPNVRTSFLGEEEFQRLFMAADPRLKPILVVAFDTGMRRSEVLDLDWERVDMEGGRILLREEDTKTSKARFTYLTARAKKALEDVPGLRVGRVFKGRLNFRREFEAAKERSGMPEIWFHDLRRSFATNARKRGVSETVVMRMTGHKTRSIFARYSIVDDSDMFEAVKKIEAGQTVRSS